MAREYRPKDIRHLFSADGVNLTAYGRGCAWISEEDEPNRQVEHPDNDLVADEMEGWISVHAIAHAFRKSLQQVVTDVLAIGDYYRRQQQGE